MADGMFMQYRSDPLTSFDGPADADLFIVGRDPLPGVNDLDRILPHGGTFAAMVLPASLAGAFQGPLPVVDDRAGDSGGDLRPLERYAAAS